MTLSLTALLIAAIVGVIVYLVCKQIPYVSSQPLPTLLGVLAAIFTYFGRFAVTL